tara:strand:+ start:15246 stop:15485 length:240 start_codon:yes stop_codon:yes gene_type:complete
MQAPKIPSFFKARNARKFNFLPRYYENRNHEIKLPKKENLLANRLFFNKLRRNNNEGKRTKKLIFILIGLFLFTYLLLK